MYTSFGRITAMIRTQIYLTDLEREQLLALTHEMGLSQSELIREAIDQFIEQHTEKKRNKAALIRAAKGLWDNRTDLPDFDTLRKEWDRK
jgi:metal-responsive CopG/Arc/MetJ family transcriptional regulator